MAAGCAERATARVEHLCARCVEAAHVLFAIDAIDLAAHRRFLAECANRAGLLRALARMCEQWRILQAHDIRMWCIGGAGARAERHKKASFFEHELASKTDETHLPE